MVIARLLILFAARLVPRADRARWREEWLGELEAVAAKGAGPAFRFALGAPTDALSTRTPMRLGAAIGADIAYASRQLIRRWAATVSIVACLIVGLVASVAAFSLVTSVLYGDMPGVAQRREIVRVYFGYDLAASYETLTNGTRVVAEPPSQSDFTIVRDLSQMPAFDRIAGAGDLFMTATGNHGPIPVTGSFASGDFFRVLRTQPVLGRFITPADDRPDAAPVAVVTEHFWRNQLDADPAAIGRPILAGGVSFSVIGVAPARFHGMQPLDIGQDDSNGVQIWLPLAHAASWPTRPAPAAPWLTTIARLRPGYTLDDARQQLQGAAARIEAADPVNRQHATSLARPSGLGSDAPFQIAMIIAAILALPMTVLAIGCANVANLQLARAAEQSRELAVRLALGATRAQLVRLLTIETLARVVVAVAVSVVILQQLIERLQPFFPLFVTIDWRVLLFAVGLSLLVALATGLMPAWLVLRRTAASQMKQNAQAGGLGHSRLRNGLVIAQVALSLALLVLTGLFTRTVQTMISDTPPVLRQQLAATFDPSELRMAPDEARRFADTVAARIAGDGRVSEVSLSTQDGVRFGLPNETPASDAFAALVGVTPSWFDVMDLPLMAGRRLTSDDDASVAVISARAAERLAPTGSALGLSVRLVAPESGDRRVQVVGIVADMPTRPTVERPSPVIYTTLPKELRGAFTLRVRSALPESLRTDVMKTINDVDPRIAWTSIRRGDMAFQDEANEMRFAIVGAGAAAVVAVILSATGLYAVMSYVILLRRREIGVRVAIGAAPGRILSLMLRQALRLVAVGVGVGLVLSLPIAFFMQASFVARVTALDPVVFIPTALLLFGVGALASLLPALRASRVDPISTLRQD